MRLTITLITFGILTCGSVSAKHWHEDEKHWKEHAKHEDQDDRGFDHRNHAAKSCYFQPRDAAIVTRYYGPRYRELPPGLQKKLYRNGHLPPGWEKRMQPLPVVVEQQLVPVPSGYRRGYIDGYAVVYSPGTQVVVDIVAVFGR
jgi:ABC-type Zn2+ transport system substrate-binding protein/surface adhesin